MFASVSLLMQVHNDKKGVIEALNLFNCGLIDDDLKPLVQVRGVRCLEISV